jgi:hypothetical protein
MHAAILLVLRTMEITLHKQQIQQIGIILDLSFRQALKRASASIIVVKSLPPFLKNKRHLRVISITLKCLHFTQCGQSVLPEEKPLLRKGSALSLHHAAHETKAFSCVF